MLVLNLPLCQSPGLVQSLLKLAQLESGQCPTTAPSTTAKKAYRYSCPVPPPVYGQASTCWSIAPASSLSVKVNGNTKNTALNTVASSVKYIWLSMQTPWGGTYHRSHRQQYGRYADARENPEEEKLTSVICDGVYDTQACHEMIAQRQAQAIIPPRKSASLWGRRTRWAKKGCRAKQCVLVSTLVGAYRNTGAAAICAVWLRPRCLA